MTTKTITTYIQPGYTLSAAYNGVLITSTGGIGGSGLNVPNAASIVNYGHINAAAGYFAINDGAFGGVVLNGGSLTGAGGISVLGYGEVTNLGTIHVSFAAVELENGGVVTNGGYSSLGATMVGTRAAIYNSHGDVNNFGTILADVYLQKGGGVRNGGVSNTGALIRGLAGVQILGGAAYVSNYATIQGVDYGVRMGSGGQLANGTLGDTVARIEGRTGVHIYGAAGTVTNFGALAGVGYLNNATFGVELGGGGSVTNGAGSDRTALISGYTGVEIFGAAGTVANFGTVTGLGGSAGDAGVALSGGGKVTNGTALDRSALISGYIGVSLVGVAGTVANYGTITGEGLSPSQAGVSLGGGGRLVNGSGSDKRALIEGAAGVMMGATGTVVNFATIEGSTGYGVLLGAGGSLTNGAVNDTLATIEGYGGAEAIGGAIANFGTILATGPSAGAGVVLSGANLTNGSNVDTGALIGGFGGVGALGVCTVTNFGAISGANGIALVFSDPADTLIVEAGCVFNGQVLGGGGTLDLASGTGTISNFAGGNVTVSGSMATTTFQNFGTVEVGAGATFTDTGAVTIAASQTVNAAGTLTLGGSGAASVVSAGLIETTGAGMLTLAGAVSGKGTTRIGGGTLFAASTFNQPVTFNGATGVLELAKSQTYAAAIRGFSKTGGTSLDLNDIAFGGSTKATFSGTATSGTLTVTDGTHTAHILLIGDYRTSTFVAASDGHGGTTIHDPTRPAPPANAPPWIDPALGDRFIAAAAALGGSAGPGIHTRETWAAPGPVLTKPRVMMA